MKSFRQLYEGPNEIFYNHEKVSLTSPGAYPFFIFRDKLYVGWKRAMTHIEMWNATPELKEQGRYQELLYADGVLNKEDFDCVGRIFEKQFIISLYFGPKDKHYLAKLFHDYDKDIFINLYRFEVYENGESKFVSFDEFQPTKEVETYRGVHI